MSATNSESAGLPASPLLRLPFEIRLIIYEYLLFPTTHPSTSTSTSIANLLPDFHTYYSEDTNNSPFTLSVRTIDPFLASQGSRTWRRRSVYHVRTGPFLTATTPTTYRVLLSPYTAHLRHNVPSLLSLNHQIHAEASKILYSTYTFSFHTCIEAAVPFLSDLTPLARSHVRHVSLTKKALPFTKEFDRAEWLALCGFLSSGRTGQIQTLGEVQDSNLLYTALPVRLHTLHLNIIAGKPDVGWSAVAPMTSADFSTMLLLGGGGGEKGLGGVDLEWAEQLMAIKGLKDMCVKGLVENCARPVSEKQAFWVAFSKSVVDGGFGEWVRGVMLGGGGGGGGVI